MRSETVAERIAERARRLARAMPGGHRGDRRHSRPLLVGAQPRHAGHSRPVPPDRARTSGSASRFGRQRRARRPRGAIRPRRRGRRRYGVSHHLHRNGGGIVLGGRLLGGLAGGSGRCWWARRRAAPLEDEVSGLGSRPKPNAVGQGRSGGGVSSAASGAGWAERDPCRLVIPRHTALPRYAADARPGAVRHRWRYRVGARAISTGCGPI